MQGPVSKLPKARFPCKCQLFPYLEKADPGLFYFRRQRARRTCLHVHLATAARVKYPAAWLRCKFDAP